MAWGVSYPGVVYTIYDNTRSIAQDRACAHLHSKSTITSASLTSKLVCFGCNIMANYYKWNFVQFVICIAFCIEGETVRLSLL